MSPPTNPVVQFSLSEINEDDRVQKIGSALDTAGFNVIYVGNPSENARGLRKKGRYLRRAKPIGRCTHLQIGRFSEGLLPTLNPSLLGDRSTLRHRAMSAAQKIQPMSFFRRAGAISEVLRMRPALLHAHGLDAFRLMAFPAFSAGIPLIYDYQEPSAQPGLEPYWFERAFDQTDALTEEATIRTARKVVIQSPGLSDKLTHRYGVELPTLLVTGPPKTTIDENKPLKERLGLDKEERVVLHIGAIKKHKRDLSTLFSALRLLPSRIHCALLAPDAPAEMGSLLLSNPDLARRIHILDEKAVNTVHETFGADAAFLGLDGEARRGKLSTELIELIYADVPLVCAAIEDAGRLVEHYHLGTTYRPDSIPDLAKQIRELLDRNEPFRIPLSSRAEFIGRFCWETQRRTLLRLYQEILRDA